MTLLHRAQSDQSSEAIASYIRRNPMLFLSTVLYGTLRIQ